MGGRGDVRNGKMSLFCLYMSLRNPCKESPCLSFFLVDVHWNTQNADLLLARTMVTDRVTGQSFRHLPHIGVL